MVQDIDEANPNDIAYVYSGVSVAHFMCTQYMRCAVLCCAILCTQSATCASSVDSVHNGMRCIDTVCDLDIPTSDMW